VLIKIGVQKIQSFSSGMNGQSLNSSVFKKSWGCSLAKGSPDTQVRTCEIAHALTRGIGWRSCGPPEPADEGKGVKSSLNAGSSRL